MFNSVTLKNTHQTEPQKYIVLSTKQIILRVGGYNKKFFFRNEVFFYFPENYSTCKRVCKSTNKTFWPY